MPTIQYRIFAWVYMLFDSAIGGGATAFLSAAGDTWMGHEPKDIKQYLMTAAIGAVVSMAFYLKRSPLPELLQLKADPGAISQERTQQ